MWQVPGLGPGSSESPGAQTLLWPVSPVTAEGAPGSHTHGGSCTLVILPSALQGRQFNRSRAGDEGRDVENGGAHIKYH